MALDTAAFQSAVENLLGTSQPSAAAAADAWAGVYDDYCAGAMFGASVPTLTGKRAAFASTLAAALAAPGVPATPAAAFAVAVAAYWTAVPVVGAQAGVTVGCPGAPAITAALVALCAAPATASSFAAGFATALDTATRTVTATVSPPPGTVLPIA
jgi:hypothetical protein